MFGRRFTAYVDDSHLSKCKTRAMLLQDATPCGRGRVAEQHNNVVFLAI